MNVVLVVIAVTLAQANDRVIGLLALPGVFGEGPCKPCEPRAATRYVELHVEVFTHSSCDAGAKGPPEAIARGWLLAHAETGEPAVWFSSRGC